MNQRTYSIGNSKFVIEFGDLTASTASVLVSSDDYMLTMGGGVSAAIRRAGGEMIMLDASKKVPVKVGDVVVTSAGALAATYLSCYNSWTGEARERCPTNYQGNNAAFSKPIRNFGIKFNRVSCNRSRFSGF